MIRTLTGLILTVAFAAVFCFQAQAQSNVLIVMFDDLAHQHPQTYMPNLDAFMQDATAFPAATSGGVVCLPSRASFLTGQTPVHTTAWSNDDSDVWETALANVTSLPEAFADEGYVTTAIAKTFHPHSALPSRVTDLYGGALNPIWETNLSGYPTGEDNFDWSQDFTDAEMGEYIRIQRFTAFINDREEETEQPWLALVGFNAPHTPFYCPDTLPIAWDSVVLPDTVANDQADIPTSGQRIDTDVYPDMDNYGTAVQQRAIHGYLNCVAYSDAQFGRLLDVLEASSFEDNTIVVVMSDHGYHLGEKQYYGKVTLWEPTTNVLYGIHIPGMAGQVINDPVNVSATMPTLMELAGIDDTGFTFDYRSLVPLIDGTIPSNEWHGPGVSFHNDSNGGNIALTTTRYKYIFTGEDLADVQVYDLNNDPNEFVNIADTHDANKITQRRNAALTILAGSNDPL